jgi:hypothetical protein
LQAVTALMAWFHIPQAAVAAGLDKLALMVELVVKQAVTAVMELAQA